MKVGIMQPYFFPYIGYWQLMNAVDKYVIFDDVNYIKRGWINRNNILVEGKKKRVNLHIKDASQNRLIKDTQVAETKEDIKRFLKTIEMSYSKAPYFEKTYELLETVMNCECYSLSEFLSYSINQVRDFLGIETDLLISSQISKDNSLKGEEKILDICMKLGADCYINAIGGMELYHRENFREKGIELRFLKAKDIVYKQFDNEFVSNLSIIDIMMFNSREEISKFLKCYSLEV